MSSNDREKISRHFYLTPLGAEITRKLDVMIARAQTIQGQAGKTSVTLPTRQAA